jgi:PAS domain S-box-containing protein
VSARTSLPSIDAVFAQLVDSIAVYERNGRVVYFNPTTEQIFGLKTEAVLGQILWELFPAARGNVFHQLFEQVARDGQTRSFEHYYAPWDRWFDNSLYAVGDHVVAWGREITQIKRDAERLEFLWQCSQHLAQAGIELGSVTSVAVQEITRSWADTSSITMVDGASGELEVVAWSARTEEGRRHAVGFMPGTKLRAGASMSSAVIARGEPVLVEQADPQQVAESVQPEFRSYVEAYPPRSFMLAPLRLGERVIGLLQATRHENQRPFHQVDLQLLQELADRVALSIHNAQLFASQQRATRRAELLQNVSAALSRAATPEEIAGVVQALVIPALGGTAGGLLVLAEDGEHLDVVVKPDHGSGYAAPYTHHPMSVPLPSTEAMRTGQPVYFESMAELAQRFPDLASTGAGQGQEAGAMVPLLGRAGTIGVLAVRYTGVHPFPQDERSLIDTMALFCSQALERARLYELERQSAARQRLLADASRTFARSKLAVAELAQRVVEIAGRELGDSCTLLLRGADARTLLLQAVWHPDPVQQAAIARLLANEPATAGVGINGTVLATGEPAFLPRFDEAALRAVGSPNHRDLVRRQGITAAIVVPLRVEGQVLGTLGVNRYQASPAYGRSHLGLLQELADLAALAIANAQNFERVQESDRRKDEFLAMLAHELRNPLAPMKTSLDLMKIRGAGVVSREWEIVDRQLGHMVRLVDDLLDVSRITHGRVQLDKAVLDLSDVLARAVEQVNPLIQSRGHRLRLEPLAAAVYVHGDSDRLAQVFTNLLSNAAKYTPQGGDIGVRIGAHDGRAILVVEDNGYGIEPDMLDAVFDLFVQGERSLDRGEGGLGLGLTLVKKLVELHGGTVSARSAGKGQGSTFTVKLPLHAPPASTTASAAATGPDVPAVGTGQPRILVVDDNQDAADILAEALRLLGHETVVAADGAQALDIARAQPLDIAILDIGLPGMNGYELAQRLREIQGAIRLVALSGYGQDRDRAASTQAGFARHLTKPVELKELSEVIAEYQASAPRGS